MKEGLQQIIETLNRELGHLNYVEDEDGFEVVIDDTPSIRRRIIDIKAARQIAEMMLVSL